MPRALKELKREAKDSNCSKWICRIEGCTRKQPFTRPQDLERHHNAVHLNIKFKCDICGHPTGQKVNLANHRRTHPGVEQLKCHYPDCPFEAASTTMMHNHQKKCHGHRPRQRKQTPRQEKPAVPGISVSSILPFHSLPVAATNITTAHNTVVIALRPSEPVAPGTSFLPVTTINNDSASNSLQPQPQVSVNHHQLPPPSSLENYAEVPENVARSASQYMCSDRQSSALLSRPSPPYSPTVHTLMASLRIQGSVASTRHDNHEGYLYALPPPPPAPAMMNVTFPAYGSQEAHPPFPYSMYTGHAMAPAPQFVTPFVATDTNNVVEYNHAKLPTSHPNVYYPIL
ncbi:hypothetical protein D9758_009355 [Tetrapyrgos nigripes]|uniref:C2H2-type domain-containing protein n=1 Tax=Tetrapyrgos nigripes TaxID=182062 RepID=A0A8H5LPL3_9AGAR|nr:hypothetical protein D9758_009355 [Tetrapyrgos nigripes]